MNFNVDLGGVISIAIVALYFLLDKYVLPVKVAKKQLIHKIQFEKEFEIYSKLWEKLNNLRNMTQRYLLFPGSPSQQVSEGAGVVRVRVPEEVSRLYKETIETILDNKPFYEDSVYKNANKLCSSSLKELFGYGRSEEEVERDRSDVDEIISGMDRIIDDIEIAIRKRIGFK